MKKRPITIIDIAKELHLSKSTVSRALTGSSGIHPETRQKVLELADKLDYQRNLIALSLSKKKTNTIGVIVPNFASSYFPNAILGIQEIIDSAGMTTLICQSNERYDIEVKNVKLMLANQVDGVIMSITRESRNFEHLQLIERRGIPLVLFNRVCDEIRVPKVVVDDYEGAYRAVEHLIKRGKKRIAHLGGPTSLKLSEKRLNGYKAALRKYKLPLNEELIVSYNLDISRVKIYVNHLLNLDERPDALFAINDPTAIEAMQIIKKKKLTIPKDIAVVGFSNDTIASLIDPPLTTIEQPVNEMGKVAARQLLHLIETDPASWKPIIKTLETKLIVRKSS